MRSFAFKTRLKVLAAATALGLSGGGFAQASDDQKPAVDSSGVGVAAGILPPPGVYGSLAAVHSGLTVKDADGNETPTKIRSSSLDAGLLWVPDFKLLGAAYGVGIFQPLRDQTLSSPRLTQQVAGTANTMLNLSTLSWTLGHGFHASVGANMFIDDVDDRSGQTFNVGRGFTTYEPRAAVTFLNSDWAVTASALVDLNTENKADHYRSGNELLVDVTALRRLGQWEIGFGSEILQQISADRFQGLVVPAVKNGRAQGNRARDVSAGPVVGYDFGKFAVQAYYQQSISAANVAAGYEVGLRVNFPIYTNAKLTQPQLDAVKTR